VLFFFKFIIIFCFFVVSLSNFFENDVDANEIISIENAYIPIFYQKQFSAAGYFILKNNTKKNYKIISIRSNFGNTTFHNSIIDENGVAKMFEISSIKLPAKSTVNFQPNNMHIMFTNIKYHKDIREIKVFFLFDDGTEISIPFKIVLNINNQQKQYKSNQEKLHNHNHNHGTSHNH